MKERIMIIDTETTNGFDTPLIYDIGWLIAERDEKTNKWYIQKKAEFLVHEVFNNSDLMARAFYSDKITMYDNRLYNHQDIECLPWRFILQRIRDDIDDNDISLVYAYNINFDLKALDKTSIIYSQDSGWTTDYKEWEKIRNSVEYDCILEMAREKLTDDEDYISFVTEHDLLTKTGKPKMSAEVVYRYFTNNPEFIESHTALADSEIEFEIFECLI